jgi:hypothetical protein
VLLPGGREAAGTDGRPRRRREEQPPYPVLVRGAAPPLRAERAAERSSGRRAEGSDAWARALVVAGSARDAASSCHTSGPPSGLPKPSTCIGPPPRAGRRLYEADRRLSSPVHRNLRRDAAQGGPPAFGGESMSGGRPNPPPFPLHADRALHGERGVELPCSPTESGARAGSPARRALKRGDDRSCAPDLDGAPWKRLVSPQRGSGRFSVLWVARRRRFLDKKRFLPSTSSLFIKSVATSAKS